MKKAAFILAISIMAACCLVVWDATKDTVLKEEALPIQSTQTEEESLEAEPVVYVDEPQSETETDSTSDKELDEDELLLRKQEGNYAFSRLTDSGKKVYVEILKAMLSFQTDAEVSTQSTETLDKVFQCVMMDHPEIFYVDGYKYTKYSAGDKIKKLTFSGNYTYGKEEADARMQQINTAVEPIINGIATDASDYEKVKYVYETIVNQTEYVLNALDNQNICSVFLGHQSVCQGYAKSMQYLLNQMDVLTTLVVGTVKEGEGHAWNLVLIDGAYYYVDPTWGDAYYLLSSQDRENTSGETPSINYDYLCVTTQQIEETHTINSVVDMPLCSSMQANYYVMEGAYFTSYDETKIESVFAKAKEQQKEAVTLKCATKEIYDEMLTELITNQRVFQFFTDSKGSIAYTTCEEQTSISFWL